MELIVALAREELMTGWGLIEGWWTEPATMTWFSGGQWFLALPATLGLGVRCKREWNARAGVTKQFEPATVPGLGFEWLVLRSLKSKWQGRWWCFPLLALWLKLSRGYKMNQYLRCSWLPTVGLSHRFLHTLWQPVQGSGRGDGCSGLHWEGGADLIVLCHLVPQSHPSHTVLCANPELAHHGRGYLGHPWNFFLSLGTFPCGEYLCSTGSFYSLSNCSLSK